MGQFTSIKYQQPRETEIWYLLIAASETSQFLGNVVICQQASTRRHRPVAFGGTVANGVDALQMLNGEMVCV